MKSYPFIIGEIVSQEKIDAWKKAEREKTMQGTRGMEQGLQDGL